MVLSEEVPISAPAEVVVAQVGGTSNVTVTTTEASGVENVIPAADKIAAAIIKGIGV